MDEEKEIITLHSMLTKINKLKQHKRKVDLVKEYKSNFAFRTVLQGNFVDNIKFPFPPGPPPYIPKPEKESVELNPKLFNFARCFDRSEHQWQRERYFTSILENVDAKDAKIIIAMKDKKLTELYPTITKELIKEAIPGLIR